MPTHYHKPIAVGSTTEEWADPGTNGHIEIQEGTTYFGVTAIPDNNSDKHGSGPQDLTDITTTVLNDVQRFKLSTDALPGNADQVNNVIVCVRGQLTDGGSTAKLNVKLYKNASTTPVQCGPTAGIDIDGSGVGNNFSGYGVGVEEVQITFDNTGGDTQFPLTPAEAADMEITIEFLGS
jgi:hypothetical protein